MDLGPRREAGLRRKLRGMKHVGIIWHKTEYNITWYLFIIWSIMAAPAQPDPEDVWARKDLGAKIGRQIGRQKPLARQTPKGEKGRGS